MSDRCVGKAVARSATIRKRERGRYAVTVLLNVTPTTAEAREIGEVRRQGRVWRHLLAPEREWQRMRDCAADLVETFNHPESAATAADRRQLEREAGW